MTAKFSAKAGCLFILFTLALGFSTKAQLTAGFTGSPLSGCAPLVVNFTDQSTGNPTQWQWDLGNSTNSTLQNPSATYFNPGQYTIRLIVTNASGSDTMIKTQYITVYALPTVAFNANPLNGCYPLNVQFTDQSIPGSGTIASWQWDFGDGITSTSQNPSHVYTNSGNFNVSLMVTNSNGCTKTVTKPQYIQVGTGVHANFNNSNPSSCSPPATTTFQNLSTGGGTLSYQWNFGDGNTSTLTNPVHTYTANGNYTVQLIVTSTAGCTDTLNIPNAVVIGNGHAAFTSADSICQDQPLTFTNTTVPAPATVSWDFGDGTFSTLLNPVKTYTSAGNYLVRMAASFGACSDTAYKTITVLPKPLVNFIGDITSSCKAPLTVTFNNLGANGVSYNWDFGDGGSSNLANPVHTYNTAGVYSVKLVVTSAFGCSDSLIRTNYIRIQPPAATINNLPVSTCVPLTWTFASTVQSVDPVVSYQWSFGDGNTSSSPNPTYTYNTAGSYNIQLIITTAGGCTDTVNVPNGIIVSQKPHANFSATPLITCAKTPVNFTDLSTSTVTQWFWMFGDGSTSTNQNPTHEYQDTGFFDVTLIIWNNGCPDTVKFNNYIYIQPPIAKFDNSFLCGSNTIQFNDHSIGADQWTWNFGDGNTSTQQNPIHTYADTGTYTVTLVVVNNITGCDHTTQHLVHLVSEKAVFYASDTVICRNSNINFTAYTFNAANVTAYDWTFGDGATGTGKNTAHTYTQSGTYDVKLVITDVNGCKDSLTKPQYIRVNGPVANFSSVLPGSCLNSAVSFTDNTTTDGIHPIQTWIWSYGDGVTDTLHAPPFLHTYAAAGQYGVGLIVTDSYGCIDSISKPNFFTISRPIANFTSLDTFACPNQPIHFTNQSVGPSPSYTWDFGDGTTDNSLNPVHSYPTDGIYTVKLIIFDQYGCSDTITKPSFINIKTPVANFLMSDSVSTCPPLIVSFTNTSQNAVTLSWDFGDGTFAQVPNPSHFYSYPGTYIVKLSITGPGTCTDVKQKQIVVRGPTGSFSYNPLLGCKPLQASFVATTLDRTSFIWDFNDGSISSTPDSLITHTYTSIGNYVPKMILVDAGGCQVPILGIDTIKVKGVDARFGLNNHVSCDNGSYTFSDSSNANDPITSYTWNFGDGGNSNLQNPVHFYPGPGLYFPQLIVTTQSGCVDTAISPAPVRIVASPQASVLNTPNGCAPLTVTFNGALLVPDTSAISWNWNFGNGNVSSSQNPPAQVYINPLSYNIRLIATNSSGCKDTVDKVIDAYTVPTVSAGVDTMICKGIGVTLNASGANTYNWSPAIGLSCTNCANPIATPDSVRNYIVKGTTTFGCSNTDTVQVKVKYPFTMTTGKGDTLCVGNSTHLYANGAFSYTWSPATGLSSTSIATPIASPSATTTYMVIGTDDHHCFRDTGYVPVKVYPIPTVDAGPDKTINVGQTIDLVPTISSDVTDAIWTPTGSIFRSSFPSITVKPRETTEYTVEVRNPGGCKARDKVTVYVVCNGANVFIPNTFSPNGDGANDVFYPRGTGLFSIKTLRVFNRWGEVVFESTNFNPNDASKGWNGTYKNVKLIPDVYVYMMDIVCDNSTILTFKGNVALIQ